MTRERLVELARECAQSEKAYKAHSDTQNALREKQSVAEARYGEAMKEFFDGIAREVAG